MQVDYGSQIHKSFFHRDISYVSGPNLVLMRNFQILQQIRILLVFLIANGGFGLSVNGLPIDNFHQSFHSFPIYVVTQILKPRRELSASVKRSDEILLVEQLHYFQIFRTFRFSFIIKPATVNFQQFALLDDTQFVLKID